MGKKEATKVFTVKADRQTSGRLLLIEGKRGVSMKDVLSYKLTIYPLLMASLVQMLMKTAKCKF